MSPEVKQGRGFNLGDYVEVKDRIPLFLEQYPDGRLVTAEVTATSEPDGKPRVWVHAQAFRTPDDPHPADGWSWMELPGTSNYTRGSELENTETSAWGRAIAALGIGIKKSIASKNEVEAKERDEHAQARDRDDDAGLTGVAEVGKSQDSDFELRQTPTGWRLGFRLVEGRKGIKAVALDSLAEQIAEYRAGIEGFRVTCWGAITDHTFTPKDATRPVTYQVLEVTRLRVGTLDLAPVTVEPEAAA